MITIFDHNLNALGVLSHDAPDGIPFFDDKFTVYQDGRMELEFYIPFNTAVSDYMLVEGFVAYKTIEGKLHLMRIISITDSTLELGRKKLIKCENAAVSDLMKNVIRPDLKPKETAMTVEAYFNKCLTGSEWTLGVVSPDPDLPTTQPFIFDTYSNSLDLIQEGLDKFELYAEYTVLMDGLQYVGKKINLYPRDLTSWQMPDSTKEQLFYYEHNLIGVEREIYSTDTINAIVPIGQASNDTISQRLVIDTSLTIPTKYQKDFYLYQDMIVSREAMQRFGKGKFHAGILDVGDVTSKDQLVKAGCEALEANKNPRARYEVDVNTLKEWMGNQEDTEVFVNYSVVIVDNTFNPPVRLRATCIEKSTSWTVPAYNKVAFGNYKEIDQTAYNTLRQMKAVIGNRQTTWGSGQGVLLYAPIDTDGAKNSTLRVADIKPNVISSNATGGVIAADLQDIDGYSTITGEIEVATAAQLQNALQKLPKYVYKRIVIRFTASITGVFVMEGFWGQGEVVIATGAFNLYGTMNFIRCACRVGFSQSTGIINGAATNQPIGNYTMQGMINIIGCTECELFGAEIYGGVTGGTYSTYGIYIVSSRVVIGSCDLFNCNTLIYAFASQISISNCTGKARSGYGVDLFRGSYLGGTGTVPQGSGGTDLANAIRLNEGSTNAATFTTSAGTIGSPAAQAITRRWTPSADASIAASRTWKFGTNWRTDNNHVYTGQWEDGIYNIGMWFFRSDMSSVLAGKTISSIKIYVTRLADTGMEDATVYFTAHNQSAYTSTGSGTPVNNFFSQYFGYSVVSATFKLGESKWVDLTPIKSLFQAASNTAKGVGLLARNASNQDLTDPKYYAKFSGECIIEVTYT